MRTVETSATVSPDGILTARMPPDIAPGEHRVLVTVKEEPVSKHAASIDLPVVHVHEWPSGLSLRREDMYGDGGR